MSATHGHSRNALSGNTMRQITIIAGDVEHPVDLQVVQEADARWNGQTIDLMLNVVLDGQLEVLRTHISVDQATLFLERLKGALAKVV
jgi:hypothetical protein